MERIIELRETGKVRDVIAHLRKIRLPQLPDSVERVERKLEEFKPKDGEEMPRQLTELQALHEVPYEEIIVASRYLKGNSPFETKHGVKGAQFENVLVVMGRGWSRYNFDQMLSNARDETKIKGEKDRNRFEDNRNLFYVACSRPQKRLALLFTQQLSADALQTVQEWFGAENVQPLQLN